MYKIAGSQDVTVTKIGDRYIEIEIEGERSKVNVNDMAYIIRECMPADEAEKTFAMVDEKEIKSGKAQVRVKAYKDIKKDEEVVFTFDISRYLDAQGKATGVRATRSGIIF